MPRQRIETAIRRRLSDILQDFAAYADIQTPIGRLRRLMGEGNRKKSYAALVSATILSSDIFIGIEQQLIANGHWDNALIALKQELEYCALI